MRSVCWNGACGLGVGAMIAIRVFFVDYLCVLYGDGFITCRLMLRVGSFHWFTTSLLAVLLSGCVLVGSMCLFDGDLRSACARFPVFSRVATPGVAVSLLLASEVRAFVSVVSVGSNGGVLFALFAWLVGLFSTYVHERDVSRHTQ